MPGIPAYLNYIIVAMFFVSLILSLGAGVLAFAKAKVNGKNAYWFGFTAFFLLAYQLLFLLFAVTMLKNQGNTILVVATLWQLSMVLSIFCLLMGLLKTTVPTAESPSIQEADPE